MFKLAGVFNETSSPALLGNRQFPLAFDDCAPVNFIIIKYLFYANVYYAIIFY